MVEDWASKRLSLDDLGSFLFYVVDPACQHRRGLVLVTQVCKSSSVALWISSQRALMEDKRPAEASWS